MTSKLFRTTSMIAVTAFSVTALCAASQSVRAEPRDMIRLAQKADGGDGQNPDAENQNADGNKKGEGRRRDGNRQDRGENNQRGDQRNEGRRDRGSDARGNGYNADGPTKTFNKPDSGKPRQPKMINAPSAAEKGDAPTENNPPPKSVVNPAIKPDDKPVAKPVVRPDTQPEFKRDFNKRDSRETTGKPPADDLPPVKTAEPPPNPAIKKNPPSTVPVDALKRNAGSRERPDDNAQRGGNAPFNAEFRDRRKPRPISTLPPKPEVKDLNDAKHGRVERREDGGKRLVIVEEDKRQIVKQGDRMVIQKDEAAQLRRLSPNAVVTRDARGRDKTVVQRRDNSQVITETDRSGQLLRRYRRDRDGRETVIIDNRRRGKDKFGRNLAIGVGVGAGIIAGAAILNSVVDVPPPRVRVPRDKYIVDYERASEDDVYEALNAPPVDDIDRSYTLDQVRATPYLRERMRRVDLDDITFETGSWDIDPSQYRKLERIARAMRRVINRNPNEVFLIEGYTDAVGSEVDNLTLSDRRAEAVSVVLTEEFDVPFENLTTQGYGEQYLKIPTDGPERANRRVAARRITPLLNRDISQAPPRPDYDDRRGYDGRDDRYDEPPRNRRWRGYN